MPTITGGAAIVESLRAEKVTDVFGLIGSAGMEIFDALYDAKDIRFIGVRDERTGVHMADGYARVSGRAGIFLAGQNGPGVTNTVTGDAIRAALACGKPAIVDVMIDPDALYSFRRDSFQHRAAAGAQ